VQEFWRGMRARQAMLHESAPRALSRLVGKNRRRYGGYIVHIGIVCMFVGIAASSMFRTEVQQTLKPGEEAHVGRYTLRYERIETQEDGHVQRLIAALPVFVDGRQIDTLKPEKRFYKKPKQPTTEVANRSTLREDLYVVLGAYDQQTQLITILGYVNPLVVWIWLGGLILALGTAVAVWPAAMEREARVVSAGAARAAAE
jgi:cytochrome c-type biogenesis protein CcmF